MKNLFKQAHKVTKAMQEGNKQEGIKTDYKATFKLALTILLEKRYNEIDKLVNVSELTSDKEEEGKEEENDKATLTDFDNLFTNELDNLLLTTISQDELIYLKDMTISRITGKTTNVFGTFNFGYGMTKTDFYNYIAELKKVENNVTHIHINENGKEMKTTKRGIIQSAFISYIMDIKLNMYIHKFLSMGLKYRELEKTITTEDALVQYSKHYASVSDDKITEFEKQDIFNTVVSDSLRLNFKSLFSDWALSELLVRAKNSMRTYLNRQRKAKISTTSTLTKDYENENIQGTKLDYLAENSKHVEPWNDIQRENHYNSLLDKVNAPMSELKQDEIELITKLTDLLSDFELELLRKRLNGMSKKEIALQDGKSQNAYNRQFKAMENKLADMLGIDEKTYKKQFISTKRKKKAI